MQEEYVKRLEEIRCLIDAGDETLAAGQGMIFASAKELTDAIVQQKVLKEYQ